ncbi:MAG: hypothetical protein JWM74_4261 [Myxococcaceae bacterium]|nr:hypothetical protein [Myxococcaceae bacterium]
MPRLSRRNFLTMAAAGAGLAAAHVWIPKKVFAAPPALGVVKRVLILHAEGGMRSSCLFNADVTPQFNPFGKLGPGDVDSTGAPLVASGIGWTAGKLLAGNGQPLTLATWGGERMPLLPQIADRISVLGAVDHDPDATIGESQHQAANRHMCTGYADGQTGLLTIITKELAGKYALAPTIVASTSPLAASVYGEGAGELARYRPIRLNGPLDFRAPRQDPRHDAPEPERALERSFDEAMLRARPNAMDGRLADFALAKDLGLAYGGVLASDALRVETAPDAVLGATIDGAPLTNAMLADAFGRETDPGGAFGPTLALGVRLLQLGSPAVALGLVGFDLHSEEAQRLPSLAGSLSRAMAALHFTLSRIADPAAPGKSYFDTTLVILTSEFNRDNVSDAIEAGYKRGFNRGDGSDHHGSMPCRIQSFPMMGGAVPGGRLIGLGTDERLKPRGAPFRSASVLATLLQALGIDHAPWLPGIDPLAEIYG